MTDNQQLMQEALQWKMHFLRKDSMFERFSKRVQTKVNERIPEKIHTVVTESVKKMVEATMAGSNIITYKKDTSELSLSEKNELAKKRLLLIRRWRLLRESAPERAAFLGIADFPLLLSIKMKCLFTLSSIYGFDVKDPQESIVLAGCISACVFE